MTYINGISWCHVFLVQISTLFISSITFAGLFGAWQLSLSSQIERALFCSIQIQPVKRLLRLLPASRIEIQYVLSYAIRIERTGSPVLGVDLSNDSKEGVEGSVSIVIVRD